MATGVKVNFNELGKTGLDIQSGEINEEFLTALKGNRGRQIYKEMMYNDPIVSGMLYAIERLLQRASWTVKINPRSESDDSETIDFVDSCMNDMDRSWSELIGEILTMLGYGFSYHEVVYKKRNGFNLDPDINSQFQDGRFGWSKIPIRSQLTLVQWEWDSQKSRASGFVQSAPPDFGRVIIPVDKSLLFRTSSRYNNPEGWSLLRGAYRPWFFKKRIEEFESIGVERDLAGLPVALIPEELLKANETDTAVIAQRKQYLDLVANIRNDEQAGVLFPLAYDDNGNKTYELTLLSTAGSRLFDTSKIIARWDQRIAMTVLADFIMLGHERVGSYALSTNKAHLFSIALESLLGVISDVFNRYAVPRLLLANGIITETPPVIVAGNIDTPNLQELGDYVSKLAKANINLGFDHEQISFFRDAARMPPLPDDETPEPLSGITGNDEMVDEEDGSTEPTTQEGDTDEE